MYKTNYLLNGHVPEFINYFSTLIEGQPFNDPHVYYHVKANKNFEFASLCDAYNGYWFPLVDHVNFLAMGRVGCACSPVCAYGRASRSVCVGASDAVLTNIQTRLNAALAEGNDEEAFFACSDLMKWGGTTGKPVGGNTNLLDQARIAGNLCVFLNNAKAYFNNPVLEVLPLQGDPMLFPGGQELVDAVGFPRSNAGLTKIYSLIVKDFVIYDSRVAAALGKYVVDYLVSVGVNNVPTELNFGWRTGQGNANRNPSTGNCEFRHGDNNNPHLESNIMANWIIVEALSKAGNRFCGKEGVDALRAVEAALFVVGYDI